MRPIKLVVARYAATKKVVVTSKTGVLNGRPSFKKLKEGSRNELYQAAESPEAFATVAVKSILPLLQTKVSRAVMVGLTGVTTKFATPGREFLSVTVTEYVTVAAPTTVTLIDLVDAPVLQA
jgi:hypothetical protein